MINDYLLMIAIFLFLIMTTRLYYHSREYFSQDVSIEHFDNEESRVKIEPLNRPFCNLYDNNGNLLCVICYLLSGIYSWLLVICYWLLIACYWLLVIVYCLLAIVYCILAIGYWLFYLGYWLFVIGYLLCAPRDCQGPQPTARG